MVSEPAAKKQPKTKSKVPVARKSKVVVTPVKRRVPVKKRATSRVPKKGTTIVSDSESESSQMIEEQKLSQELSVMETESEDESQNQIEQLRQQQQLAELDANQESRNPLKSKR